jgi:hypothetical protein
MGCLWSGNSEMSGLCDVKSDLAARVAGLSTFKRVMI